MSEAQIEYVLARLLAPFYRRMDQMALDLTAITAAVTKVSADVDNLIAANANATATDQAAVNALIPTITAVSQKAEAALAPAPAAPATPAA